MTAEFKRRLSKWLIVLGCAGVAAAIVGAYRRDIVDALVYQRPVRYDQPFHPAVAAADRIVVRSDGYDCCHPVSAATTLFVVTSPAEVADIRSHLRFQPLVTSNSMLETCMCCGEPGMDWYRGSSLIARTAFQHGKALRWRGFSTSRILGVSIGYGDAPLTAASRDWLAGWLERRQGLPMPRGAGLAPVAPPLPISAPPSPGR